ncbi:MAG: TlyA family RNA methyltransferase [Anaerolineae bacterium]|nr:TlyA family RNA methyltransferase [Anaerolineae bacterium]
MKKKERLDVLMYDRHLAESRSLAQRLIMAGRVRVDDQVVIKPSQMIDPGLEISIDPGQQFVSRGGQKLQAALLEFGLVDLSGFTCVDIGASTGGFVDCLLQHGAARVHAVDVGHGLLHWKLRNDPRVVVMERTNARDLAGFSEPIDMVTIDASFISLKLIVQQMTHWLQPGARLVALIKPQFEAGRKDAARGGGVIRDAALHRQIVEDILSYMRSLGFGLHGVIRSPLKGPKGNTEFLAFWTCQADDVISADGVVSHLFDDGGNVG